MLLDLVVGAPPLKLSVTGLSDTGRDDASAGTDSSVKDAKKTTSTGDCKARCHEWGDLPLDKSFLFLGFCSFCGAAG